jgi:excisionase family DNA binding protein
MIIENVIIPAQNSGTVYNDMFLGYPDVLTMDDLQVALGIGRNSAYRLINSGKINHLRIGKAIRIPKKYLVDFVFASCYNDDATIRRH